jgi:hypothetical protein
MRWIVRWISRIRTDARDRELATFDIPDVRKFEQRTLGAGESVKLRERELDERRLGRKRGSTGTARNRGTAQKERRYDGER